MTIDSKMSVYFLFRKGGVGTVAKMGGIKLSEGCLLVPSSVGDEIVDGLKAFGVDAKKLEIYLSEDYIKAMFGQRNQRIGKLLSIKNTLWKKEN